MRLAPETAMIRRQVLSKHAMKRALRGTSAMTTEGWEHVSADAPSEKTQEIIANNAAAAEALKRREPIMVFLSEAELKHCGTWEEMKVVLAMKGVPDDRIDGAPDIRADEYPDGETPGLMLEIC